MGDQQKPWQIVQVYFATRIRPRAVFEAIQAAGQEQFGIIIAGWESDNDELPTQYWVSPGFERFNSGRQELPYVYESYKGIHSALKRIQEGKHRPLSIAQFGMWCWELPDKQHILDPEYIALRSLLPKNLHQ